MCVCVCVCVFVYVYVWVYGLSILDYPVCLYGYCFNMVQYNKNKKHLVSNKCLISLFYESTIVNKLGNLDFLSSY